MSLMIDVMYAEGLDHTCFIWLTPGPQHEEFEDILFLWLGLPSTLIRHEKGDLRPLARKRTLRLSVRTP